ncbi:MAG: G5 domain-containing protein [Clostridiales bacterium]|jgi:LysM repeat protein|nr:G5 domain-containing protein [Clostridiales bacterium]
MRNTPGSNQPSRGSGPRPARRGAISSHRRRAQKNIKRKRQRGGRGPRSLPALIITVIGINLKKLSKRFGGAAGRIPLGALDGFRSHIFAAGAFVCALSVAAVIWALTNKNAWAVYIGDSLITHVKYDKNLDAEYLTHMAASTIENAIRTNVKINEAISLKRKHAGKSEIIPNEALFTMLSSSLSYQIEADSISVNGQEAAVLKNDADTESLKDKLCAPYIKDPEAVLEKEVVGLTVEKRFVDSSEVLSVDDAAALLSKEVDMETSYTVAPGDYMQSIAAKFNTSVESLCKLNDIAPENVAKIQVGQTLKILAKKPLLDIRTLELEKHREPSQPQVVTRENAAKPKSYTQVLQAGAPGEDEVTEHVEKLNGLEVSREVVGKTPVVLAQDRLVEVGTL